MKKVLFTILSIILSVSAFADNAQIVPEGEPLEYEFSAMYTGSTKLTGLSIKVCFSTDGQAVYFSDLFSYYNSKICDVAIWTKGTISDNGDGTKTVTIPLQYVNEHITDKGKSHMYVGGATNNTISALKEYQLTLDAEGNFTAKDQSQYLVLAQVERNTQTGKDEIAARLAYHNKLTITRAKGDMTLVTPPASAQYFDYSYSYKDQNAKSKIIGGKVAVDGRTVYFNRLCPNFDDVWVKGTADQTISAVTETTTIHIPTNQFLGSINLYNMWFKAAHENEKKEGEYSTYTLTDEVTLTYTAKDASFKLTNKDLCIEGLYSGNIASVNYSFTLTKVNSDTETNPVEADNISVLDMSEYEPETPYCLMFYALNQGENGETLNTDKLYYRVLFNNKPIQVDGSELIPYSKTGGDFGTGDNGRHWMYFSEDLVSTVGVQMVYIHEDKQYTSRVNTVEYLGPNKDNDEDVKEVAASKNSVFIGYTDGNIASTQSGKICGNHAAGTYECFIKLSANNLEKFKGNTIKSVRVGMPSGVVSYPTVKVWIRTSPTGDNIAESQQAATKSGWNTIYLNNDVEVTDGQELYIGYTYTQSSKLSIISFTGQTVQKGCYVRDTEGETYNFSGRNWGSLSIEAEVFGTEAITNDIRLTELSVPVKMVKKGDKVTFVGKVRNMGIYDLTGYSIEYKVGKNSGMEYINKAIASRAEDEFQISYKYNVSEAQNNIPVEVKVALLGGLTDDLPANNSGTTSFCIYDQTYPRNVLIEEFTTEQCGWCPQGAYMIHKAIEELEQDATLSPSMGGDRERIFWACYHAGFGTDWLTTTEAETYTRLYNAENTFAPAWSLDRNTAYAKADNQTGTVWNIPTTNGTAAAKLKDALSQPAFVYVDAETTQEQSGTALITVSLTKNISLFGQCEKPLLTVLVVEDSITPHNQKNYAGEQYALKAHNNVLRSVITPVWGQEIQWTDNTAEAQFTYQIPEGCNRDNLKIIAFVHEYNATDTDHMQVLNCGGCRFPSKPSGIIETHRSLPTTHNASYNLSGQRVNSNFHGITIQNGKLLVK